MFPRLGKGNVELQSNIYPPINQAIKHFHHHTPFIKQYHPYQILTRLVSFICRFLISILSGSIYYTFDLFTDINKKGKIFDLIE